MRTRRSRERGVARSGRHDLRAALSAAPAVAELSSAGSAQTRAPDAGRVLGLLPPNSLRTLPYLKAWHERYASAGLRTIGVHCPGFEPSRDEAAVRTAVARLDIRHPVVTDR